MLVLTRTDGQRVVFNYGDIQFAVMSVISNRGLPDIYFVLEGGDTEFVRVTDSRIGSMILDVDGMEVRLFRVEEHKRIDFPSSTVKFRIGIEAPRDVLITRGELL